LLTVCRKILNFNFIVVALLQDYFILSSPAKQWIEQIDNSANVKFQQQPLVVDATLAAGKKKGARLSALGLFSSPSCLFHCWLDKQCE
jgi:hypothetical protein